MTDKPNTPTTLEIRKAFMNLDGTFANGAWDVGSLKRFDRWYQDEIAAAEQRAEQRGKEQGWDEGYSAATNKPGGGNPYRSDQIKEQP